MSDFWSRKLGQQQSPQPARPAMPTNRPWWDTTQAPQPVPQAAPEEYTPPQAKSARHMENCPDCGAGDYMGDPSSPNARKRCFSCGYPYAQTGSQGIQTKGGAPATPARQVHDGSSNYQPGKIIGRIG